MRRRFKPMKGFADHDRKINLIFAFDLKGECGGIDKHTVTKHIVKHFTVTVRPSPD
jgi:hypothetical protein